MDKMFYQLTAYDMTDNIPEVKYFRSQSLGDLLTFLGQNQQFSLWYVVKYRLRGIFRKKYDGVLVCRSAGLEGR
jgi:hypothetical protein